MKKTVVIVAIVALVVTISGCDILAQLLGGGAPSPTQQVQGFLDAANADPRDTTAMRAYFDVSAAGYASMLDAGYWDGTAFAESAQDFGLAGPVETESTDGTSATVSGTLTTGPYPLGVPVVFALELDPTDTSVAPLISLISFPPVSSMQDVIDDFLAAASLAIQVPEDLKAFFDPAAADYDSMQLATYWSDEYFAEGDGPFSINGAADGPEDPVYPGSLTVTGTVTNFVNPDPGYPAVFVFTQNPVYGGDPLIRQIIVDVAGTDEIIRKITN